MDYKNTIIGNEYSKYADKLAYNLAIMAKGGLTSEFIQYKLGRKANNGDKTQQTLPQKRFNTLETNFDFNLQYHKESEERKAAKSEERELIKNYFANLLTGKEAEERIKLLTSKYRNRKI